MARLQGPLTTILGLDRDRMSVWASTLAEYAKPHWKAARKWIKRRKPSRKADIWSEADADGLHIEPTDPARLAIVKSGDGMRDYPTTRPHLAFDYMAGLIRWLAESEFQVLAYHDLAGPWTHGAEKQEFARWTAAAAAAGHRSVLLQYDVDARPEITTRLLKVHIDAGVPANAMVFREKIFDWKLKQEGSVEVDADYNLDFATLEAFQKSGGVVGYHCNAFDRCGGDADRAIEIFHDDVAALRRHFDIRFFSMHGGHVTADGRCNANLPVQAYLESLGLAWVHNGHSVYFHANWADGSASNPRYRNEANDPLDFLFSAGIGQRVRLLFHPQYYGDQDNRFFDFPVLQDQNWVQKTRSEVESGDFDGRRYWQRRWQGGRKRIDKMAELLDMPRDEEPVFVHGMSRSGTTLLVSMLDAHPQGAMAYESYPRYLHEPSDGGVLTAEEFIYAYQVLLNYPEQTAFKLLNRPPLRNLMRFAAVTGWTGMTTRETGELLRAYLVDHHRITDTREALKIVAASARFKLRRTPGARFWGSKCQGGYADYFSLWPQARLIYIMRHGLDILASQKSNGAFHPDPNDLGRRWRKQFERFGAFKKANPDKCVTLVSYERLAAEPVETSRQLCAAIGKEYHDQMARPHEIETTLVRNPRGQLSAERVQQPIDQAAIGRWRDRLSYAEVKAFLEGCGGSRWFEAQGYDWQR